VLNHPFSNQPAHVDPLVALQAKGRAPQSKADIAGEIVVSVSLMHGARSAPAAARAPAHDHARRRPARGDDADIFRAVVPLIVMSVVLLVLLLLVPAIATWLPRIVA
jgi:hypothetical protein